MYLIPHRTELGLILSPVQNGGGIRRSPVSSPISPAQPFPVPAPVIYRPPVAVPQPVAPTIPVRPIGPALPAPGTPINGTQPPAAPPRYPPVFALPQPAAPPLQPIGPAQPAPGAPTNGTKPPAVPGTTAAPATYPNTPVPVTFPTNQYYVNTADGTVWEYSASAGTWVNTGVPYNVNAPTPAQTAAANAAAQAATTTPTIATTPVSTTIAPDLTTGTSYQSILDWLSQNTLAASIGFNVPNFVVVIAVGGAVLWIMRQPKTGRR
jgi:hypothetical protein